MSWRAAQDIAAKIYAELRREHSPAFIRMVVRALDRLLNAEHRNDKTP